MSVIRLPRADRSIELYALRAPAGYPAKAVGPFDRVAFAAAHLVHDHLAEQDPWLDARIDWDATLAFRRHLWGLGFAVAEAMDTAQRGMGLDWPNALELIRRSLGRGASGAGRRSSSRACGTDHLAPARDATHRRRGRAPTRSSSAPSRRSAAGSS